MLSQISFAQSPVTISQGGTAQTVARSMGLIQGTLVRTPRGDVAVESLLAGDVVLNQAGEAVELRGTSARTLKRVELIDIRGDLAVAMGAAAGTRLCVPADQPVVVNDWRAMVVFGRDQILSPAASLVDGINARRVTKKEQRVFKLHFDKPQVILANGIPVGSARDRAPMPANDTPLH